MEIWKATLTKREGEPGGSFSLRWTNDGLLEEVFGGLGEEGEVGCGRMEDVFVDFRPSIVTLRL